MAIPVSWPQYYQATLGRLQASAAHTKQSKNFQKLEAFCQEEWAALPTEKIKSLIHNYHERLLDVKCGQYMVLKTGVCTLLIKVISVVSVVIMI